MKKLLPWLGLAVLTVGMTAGCGHLNLVPIGEPERVLNGTVRFPDGFELPPGGSVQVRVLDESNPGAPVILGEQVLADIASYPVSFRVEYTAEDALLRRGLNVEVRVSYGGKVQLFNRSGTLITSIDADSPHDIRVQRMVQ